MKCPKCGAEVVRGEKTCWQCYLPLEEPAAPAPAEAQVPAPRRRPLSMRRLAVLAVVIAALGAAGGGYYYWSEFMGPKGCARAFCQALAKGDGKALYGLLSSADRENTTQQEVQAAFSMFGGEEGPSIEALVKEVTRSGRSARAKVALTTSMGRSEDAMSFTMTMPLIMVRERGGWRVDMAKSQQAAMESFEMPNLPAAPQR